MAWPDEPKRVVLGPVERALLGEPVTDMANGERFAERHKNFVRYHHGSGWLVWDQGLWRRDNSLVERMAQETVRAIYLEAASVEDPKMRAKLAKWATTSEAAPKLRAMLECARSSAEMRIDPAEMDANPWVLNVRNGKVCLKTGQHLPSDPYDYCTKQAPVDYLPGATHPVWDAFLESSLPDPELRHFVQMAAGYSLTGDTSCEVLFFVYGPTRSGKSTFTNAIKAAIGDYSTTASFETFLAKKSHDSRNEMAALWGTRLVVSLEVDRGRRFASALIKAITGMDSIKAMFKYHEEFEYRPQFKLWLVANDRPRADSEDDALWRRIIVLPFDHAIDQDKADPMVKETLMQDTEARQAVLAWAVQGCVSWFQNGRRLVPPSAVTHAVDQYREECDELAPFFEECCEFDPEAESTSSDILTACKEWCIKNGVREPWTRDVADRLIKHGAKNVKRPGGKRLWQGVRITGSDMFS